VIAKYYYSFVPLSNLLLVNNNNNQVFYSQASWGRLEMKPHEPKTKKKEYKTRVKKKGKTKDDKKAK
jgi:hypothetical protein